MKIWSRTYPNKHDPRLLQTSKRLDKRGISNFIHYQHGPFENVCPIKITAIPIIKYIKFLKHLNFKESKNEMS